MQESTKYSAKVVDTVIYLLMCANLVISCFYYTNITNQFDAYKEQLTRITNANLGEIAELTIQSANRDETIKELQARINDLSTENSELRSKVERMEGSYPFTTVYDLARIACQNYDDVDPAFVLSVAYIESGLNPKATNDETLGLMQVNPKWHFDRAERLGVTDYTDPYGSILLGTDYLHEIHQDLITYQGVDDWNYVLMVYNMGYSKATSIYKQGVISEYAKSVMECYNEYQRIIIFLGDI